MNVFKLGTEYKTPLAITLGFFDCIHRGHAALVAKSRNLATLIGGESALFTFGTDPSDLLGGEKQIYCLSERAHALENLGLDNLVYADFDIQFAEKSPFEFLNALISHLNIKAIVVGLDYRFGKNAQGDIEFLNDFCLKNGIILDVEDFTTADGHKISTSSLKKFVKSGKIELLNPLLSEPYFMIGEVGHARHVGTKIGFPTANIEVDKSKLLISDGIYATRLYVDGKHYDSMTNIGAKPTFGIDNISIETYIFDFDGDLYSRRVKLAFFERTRDVTKFASADDLKRQLAKDESQIRLILSKTNY